MYHLAVKNLKQIMMEHRSLIYNQPLLKTVFRKPPIISYKKGKSLKDMLVRAKYNLKAIMRRDHKSHMGSSCMSVLTFILRIRLFYWKKDPTKTRTQPYWSFKSQRSTFAKKRFASWKVLCLVAVIWLRRTLSTKIIEPCIGKEQSVKRWFGTPVPPPREGRLRTALENAALNEPLSFVASKFFATIDYSFSIWYSKMLDIHRALLSLYIDLTPASLKRTTNSPVVLLINYSRDTVTIGVINEIVRKTHFICTDFLLFFIAYFFLPNSNSSLKTISISADDDFSPLRRYSFKYRNLFTSYVNKYIKTGCTYNRKDWNELYNEVMCD